MSPSSQSPVPLPPSCFPRLSSRVAGIVLTHGEVKEKNTHTHFDVCCRESTSQPVFERSPRREGREGKGVLKRGMGTFPPLEAPFTPCISSIFCRACKEREGKERKYVRVAKEESRHAPIRPLAPSPLSSKPHRIESHRIACHVMSCHLRLPFRFEREEHNTGTIDRNRGAIGTWSPES